MRVTMIPLCWTAADEQVLDANTSLISTRYARQRSCMGLYARYEALAQNGGAWWVGRDAQRRVVGISSARPDGFGFSIDGFAHRISPALWSGLIDTAVGWARAKGTGSCHALVSSEDEEKQQRFVAAGWHQAGSGARIGIDERQVPTVRLRLDAHH